MTRPACWSFAMSFLGDPEATEIENYVSNIEALLQMSPTARYLQSLRASRELSPAYSTHIEKLMQGVANDLIQAGVNQSEVGFSRCMSVAADIARSASLLAMRERKTIEGRAQAAYDFEIRVNRDITRDMEIEIALQLTNIGLPVVVS